VGPNEKDVPRVGSVLVLVAFPIRAGTDGWAGAIRLAVELGLEPGPPPTPMRPAIAASRSSISAGILGAGKLGRSSVPSVVVPREGLLVGGNTIDDRVDPETGVDVGIGTGADPARGGGRGRGAHPVRRGSGLGGSRGDEAE
jgi:hypothetical protein